MFDEFESVADQRSSSQCERKGVPWLNLPKVNKQALKLQASSPTLRLQMGRMRLERVNHCPSYSMA